MLMPRLLVYARALTAGKGLPLRLIIVYGRGGSLMNGPLGLLSRRGSSLLCLLFFRARAFYAPRRSFFAAVSQRAGPRELLSTRGWEIMINRRGLFSLIRELDRVGNAGFYAAGRLHFAVIMLGLSGVALKLAIDYMGIRG